MVVRELPKLETRVRFSYPAPAYAQRRLPTEARRSERRLASSVISLRFGRQAILLSKQLLEASVGWPFTDALLLRPAGRSFSEGLLAGQRREGTIDHLCGTTFTSCETHAANNMLARLQTWMLASQNIMKAQ